MAQTDADEASADLLSAGRQALASGDWDAARACFQAALAEQESPEALEGLSWTAWWLNESDTLFRTRERAYRLYRAGGDHTGAARMAIWLAWDHRDFRGEKAIANGWRQRARRLLDGLHPTPEHGWLALHEGDVALFARDDTAAAKRYAQEAAELGRQFAKPDLAALGLAMEGIALVTEGNVVEGMNRLDEAATAALTGELQEMVSVSWALCYLISACERVHDYDRAAQWCQKMKGFAQPYPVRFLVGVCRAHYGGVLVWRGMWDQAEAELTAAAHDIEISRPPLAAEAVVRLAELRRRQGRLREAAQLLDQVEWHPLAVLSLAELALDRGDTTSAAERAQSLLRNVPADNKTQRVAALDILVRAAAVAGDLAGAREMLEVLKALSSAMDSVPLRAVTNYSEGVVAAAGGDDLTAQRCLEEAAIVFGRVGAPYEMGRARIELARVLSRLGRLDAAEQEAASALKSFQEIGAAAQRERVCAFIRELKTARARAAVSTPQPKLTARELDVLRLVAQGLRDREIAATLTLSEHTVHRHVANILSKLNVPSRAAAVAEVARQDLL